MIRWTERRILFSLPTILMLVLFRLKELGLSPVVANFGKFGIKAPPEKLHPGSLGAPESHSYVGRTELREVALISRRKSSTVHKTLRNLIAERAWDTESLLLDWRDGPNRIFIRQRPGLRMKIPFS